MNVKTPETRFTLKLTSYDMVILRRALEKEKAALLTEFLNTDEEYRKVIPNRKHFNCSRLLTYITNVFIGSGEAELYAYEQLRQEFLHTEKEVF